MASYENLFIRPSFLDKHLFISERNIYEEKETIYEQLGGLNYIDLTKKFVKPYERVSIPYISESALFNVMKKKELIDKGRDKMTSIKSIKDIDRSDLIISLFGLTTGTISFFIGIFVNLILSIGGLGMITVAFIHLVWASQKHREG